MKLKLTVLFIILCAAVSAPVFAEDDKGKEISKDWQAAIEAYKAAPDASATIERMNNFAERWKNSNRYEASRAKYLNAEIFYKGKKYQAAFDAYKKVVDEFGSSPYADSAMYKMGECLYNMGKYTQAIELLTNYRFKFSSSVFHMEAVYVTALSYLNLLEYKKADRELTQFLEKNPFYAADEKVKLIGGIIDFYLERYDASAEKLKRIKRDAAYYYMGHSLTKSGKYLEAATAFKKLGEEFKTSKYLESAQYNKAEAFYKGLNFPVAAADYKAFILRFPASELTPYASLKYASTLFNDRKYKEAAKAYDNVMAGGGDARVKAYARYLSGECARKLDDNKGALVSYEKVISDYPTIYDALASAQLRAGWCYLNLGQYDKAEEILTSFTQKFTTHDDIATGYYLLGNANYNKKQYDQAVARYRFILEKFNYSNISEAALLMMALSYYNQKQYDMLATEVAHSLNQLSAKFKDPEGKKIRARSYFYLGQAYFKTGLFGPAAKAFKSILDDYYESDITNEARANLAWCYYELENFQGARTMARDVINSNLTNAEVKSACEILIAHSYFSEKNFETAIVKYTDFAYSHSKDKNGELTAEALFQKGKAQEIMEAYGDALESWKTSAINYPKSKRAAESTFKAADIYFKAQQYQTAIDWYRQVMIKFPDTELAEDSMLAIAEVYYNSGKEAEAVKSYNDFLKKYPDSNKIQNVEEGMQRAMFVKAEKQENPDMMLEFYEKYPESNLAMNSLYSAAELYYKNNKFEKAIDTFNKLIEQFPNDSMAINANYYVAACYQELKRFEDAIAAYKAFVKNYPKHELAAEVTFNLATTAFQVKNYPEAIFYYERILEKYPDSQYANNSMYNSALAYTELGKHDDAIKIYNSFMLKFGDDDKSKGLKAYIAQIYFEQKRYVEALKAYEEVYQTGTDDEKIQALYTMGNIYGTTENFEKQIETYNRLIDVKPADNVYRLNGLVDLAGKYEEKQAWKDAVRIYEVIKVSNGTKEYVDFATNRIPTIQQAYPEAFKVTVPKTK
ncbi:MAG: hypothetical protein CVV21_01805 [Candidatus Goldiibacteriota bacterium HGW-Goldbacteria-1]|jgi:TolA-binding protein|nr:MAG: hypothetical protein CVV21_01805 [Candidatus Goldiibacteriota bacterium HGW-Goldbacteria-1]